MLTSRTYALAAALALSSLSLIKPADAITINSFNFELDNQDVVIIGGPPGEVDFLDSISIIDQDGGGGFLTGLTGFFDLVGFFAGTGDVTPTLTSSLEIDDGGGFSLSGIVTFNKIDFANSDPLQTVGLDGTVTFDPGYGGANADMISLATSSFTQTIAIDLVYSQIDDLGVDSLTSLVTLGDAGESPVLSLAVVTTIPEPNSLALLGLGLLGMGLVGRRMRIVKA